VFAAWPKSKISLTGKTDLQIDMTGAGETAVSAINDAKGEARINAANGTVSGIDLLQLHAGSAANPEIGSLPEFSGETAFRELEALIGISREKANVARLLLSNSQLIAELSGETNHAAGGIALQLDLKPGPAAPASPQAAQKVQLLIGGSLANPLFTRVRAENAPQ
jgi:uncharacterized protein involved in outer membrane biogenesis